MSDYYATTDGIALVADEAESTFTFNGVDYPCAAGERTADKSLGDGGLAPISGVQIVVNKSLLPATTPEENDAVTYDGKALRINMITHSPDGGFLVLDCVDANLGV